MTNAANQATKMETPFTYKKVAYIAHGRPESDGGGLIVKLASGGDPPCQWAAGMVQMGLDPGLEERAYRAAARACARARASR